MARPFSRAKIFQPFDALPGLRELLREKEIEHEKEPCPERNGERLDEIIRHLRYGQQVIVHYIESGLRKKFFTAFEGIEKERLVLEGTSLPLDAVLDVEVL